MRKIIGFIIIVILIILIIILSNKYYGNQSKKKTLSNTSDSVTRVNTNSDDNTNTNNNSSTSTNNNSTVVEEKNAVNKKDSVDEVPDTATDDNSGYIPVESFSVNIKNSVLNVGDSEQIIVNINPSNASLKEVIFTSSNKDVLTVTSTGIIKAKKSGSSLVTVSMKNHNDYKIIINVK